MTDKPTDEALENLFVEETGFDIDDFPAAIFDFARAVLAKLGQPAQQAPAGESLRTEALCDLSYSHGLKAGWNYCASDDLAGFERAQKIGTEALRTLKSPTAQQAPAGATAWRSVVLDLIDECPGLTMEQDHWLSRRVKDLDLASAPMALDHIAAIEDGELRYMTGRKAPAYDCELYAMPDGKRAPVLFTAPQPVARQPLTDEQIQDLLLCGNPTDEEMRLIRIGWDAAHGIKGGKHVE